MIPILESARSKYPAQYSIDHGGGSAAGPMPAALSSLDRLTPAGEECDDERMLPGRIDGQLREGRREAPRPRLRFQPAAHGPDYTVPRRIRSALVAGARCRPSDPVLQCLSGGGGFWRLDVASLMNARKNTEEFTRHARRVRFRLSGAPESPVSMDLLRHLF